MKSRPSLAACAHAPAARVQAAQPATSLQTSERRVGSLGLHPVQWGVSLAAAILWAVFCGLVALLAPSTAQAQVAPPFDPSLLPVQIQVQQWMQEQTGTVKSQQAGGKPWRVTYELGQIDPRLKLAACLQSKVYLPAGAPLWGRTRVGIRCEQGPVRWNIYWPVTIQVWGPAVIATVPLRPGAVLTEADLRMAEVDLAGAQSPAVPKIADLVGRVVGRSVEAGQSVRQDDIRARRWFNAGETVQVLIVGDGFRIEGEGLAITHGDEGQCAKIRVDNGRSVCGMPVGDHRVEVAQ